MKSKPIYEALKTYIGQVHFKVQPSSKRNSCSTDNKQFGIVTNKVLGRECEQQCAPTIFYDSECKTLEHINFTFKYF